MPPTTADLPATLSQGDVGTTDNLSTEIEEKRGVEKKEKMVTAAIGIEVQEQMEVEKKEIDEREKMKVAATEIKIQEPMEVDEKEIDEKKQTGVATTEIEIKGEMVVEERDIEKKEKKEGVKDKEIENSMDIDEEEPKFFDRNVKVYNPPPDNMQMTHSE